MPRRSSLEIAHDHEERAAKLRADSDRRRSVASDATCELMWEAECALRRLAAYCGMEGKDHAATADSLKGQREARWADLKARGLA